MSGHHAAIGQTDDWLTPRFILDALGPFALDPATPEFMPWNTAERRFTKAEDGLAQPWDGRVWLNAPYSNLDDWLAKLADHDHGSALIFARTETVMFFKHVWERAAGLLFLRGRLHFHHVDGRRAAFNGGAPSVLCAYGQGDLEVLSACGLDGQFVPLRFSRAVVALAVEPSWREAIMGWLREQDGPVRLDDVYRAFAGHPKARRNRNWQAKIRQTLQRARAQRVAPATYEGVAA